MKALVFVGLLAGGFVRELRGGIFGSATPARSYRVTVSVAGQRKSTAVVVR